MSEDAAEKVIDFDIPTWVWWLGLGLAGGCVVLLGLYYVQNPGRSPFTDFARPEPPETNGSVPHGASPLGLEALQGTEQGEGAEG